MSEETKNTVETEVTGEVESTGVEETTEEKPTRESALATIKNKVKNFFSGGAEEDTSEVVEVEIPTGFVEAIKSLEWTPEEIQEFAKDYSKEELEEMIPFLTGEDSEESDETSSTASEDDEASTTDDDDSTTEKPGKKKDEDSQEDEKIRKLQERLEALEKAQGKSQKAEKEQELVNLVERASQMFDEASKEFEIFGSTDKLPKFPDGRIIPTSPQMKARSEVWELAYRLKGSGLSFDEAMSVALNSFKGKNLANDVHRKIVKDLKQHEQRLSGKRISHESTAEIKNPLDVIKEVKRKHGIET